MDDSLKNKISDSAEIMDKSDTLYIVEERISKKTADHYMNDINDLNRKSMIGKDKYMKLQDRLDEGWVISDSLSYSKDYDSILAMYKEMSKNMPSKEFRIAKAVCSYHEERGISIEDFDYQRIDILKKLPFVGYAKEPVTNNYVEEFNAAKHFSDKDIKIIDSFNKQFGRPLTIKEMLEKYYANKERIMTLSANIDEIKSRQLRLNKAGTLLDKYEKMANNQVHKSRSIFDRLFNKNINSDTEKERLIGELNRSGVRDRSDFVLQEDKLRADIADLPKMENGIMECNALNNSLRAVVDVLNRALNKENEVSRDITRDIGLDR